MAKKIIEYNQGIRDCLTKITNDDDNNINIFDDF